MATYIRLTDYKNSDEKEQEFFNSENRYEAKQEDFSKIPGSPIGYWLKENIKNIFSNEIFEKFGYSGKGLDTCDNDLYTRNWSEINFTSIGLLVNNNEETFDSFKWYPFSKGGEFRKWFGNLEVVVLWENDGEIVRNIRDENGKIKSRPQNTNKYFKNAITWSSLGGTFGARKIDKVIFGNGAAFFPENSKHLSFFNALMNTKVVTDILKVINPTLSFLAGDIKRLPIIFPSSEVKLNKIENLTQQNINISKEEWDSRETSWDFIKNELIKHKTDTKIETAYKNYCNYWQEQHNTLHQNEEELNRLFIDIYELQDELTLDVELKDITILKNETKIIDGALVFQADEIMKQFISYGVGVMFGRYSLDSDGLLIANMGQAVPTSNTFEIDDDNVIPVLEDDYFKDDIASRFVQFVKATFGEEDLSKNIRFIESSLGTTLRKYFVKGFYEDHIKRYKKRPIYWMVASPKKGFMSLIYMHRYQSDIFARVRNSYLTEYIAKLEAHKEILHLTTTSQTASDKDKKDADKRIKDIETKLKELIAFDRDTMMSFSQNNVDIDLDDGVKINYSKFKEILYEIKGLNKDE